jgi:dipeptidyl aminopeptidase/acylaminoacyl peptidase
MRKLLSYLAIFLSMSISIGTAPQAKPAAKPVAAAGPTVAITDPTQIASKEKWDVQALSIEKLYMSREIGDSAWAPDGKQIAFISNISGRDNLWIVPSEGGWPVQLTVSNQRQQAPAWSPKGRWIAYISDTDGNEQWDIFLVSPRDGQVVNLTNTTEISEDSPAWSPDGERLAYRVRPKDSPNSEIDVIDVATRKVTHLTTNTPKELQNSAPTWSKDGKWILFTQTRADDNDSNVLLTATADGKSVNLTPHEGDKIFQAADLSPDGKTALVTSNALNGYNNAALVDVASKKISWLTRDRWEVMAGKFSPSGKLATFTANVDGSSEIFAHNLVTGRNQTLPLPKGLNDIAGANTPFAPGGTRLLYGHEGAGEPGDLWVYDFTTQKSFQVTHSLVGGVRSEDMVQPFLVHYPSKDGKWQISAFFYVPFNAERNGKNAAVVFAHGGPANQVQNSFNRRVQYLVNQGFFVILPNFRGSSGYGKEFEDANRFDMGGGDLDDVISAADWIVKTGYIDPKKIAIMGGSYGGYLTLMAAAKAPDRWAAAAPFIPFVNWFTVLEHTEPNIRDHFIAVMGDPMKDKDRLRDRSPIYFVDKIQAPLLLLAGGNDPRCPPTEAEQVTQAIKKRGGSVELKIYDNEGHGFSRVENQIDAMTRIAEFLKKYVPPEKCGCNLDEVSR